MVAPRNWTPGSFTKNFSWGPVGSGLELLHRAIGLGFDHTLANVPRDLFRERLRAAGINDYIPANFFLFNIQHGHDEIVADELVRAALENPPGHDFNHLATFALNFSMAGTWKRAKPEQRYPSEWAKHFIVEEVFSSSGRWDSSVVNAREIQSFIETKPSYSGVWAGKAATNLNYIYDLADVKQLRSGLVEYWWGSAIVLALDRIAIDRAWKKPWPTVDAAISALREEHVFELTAVPIDQGMIAARDIVDAYFDEGISSPSPSQSAPAVTPPSVGSMLLNSEKVVRPVERVYEMASRQIRDRQLVAEIRRLYTDSCAVCGFALPIGNGQTYAEVGHIRPVGLPFKGPDHISNVLPFCPNHHRQFDRGAIYFEVQGSMAKVVHKIDGAFLGARTFTPAPGHSLDMRQLKWHADYFLQL